MAKNAKNDSKQNSKLVSNLDEQINKLKDNLAEIKDTINKIQNGDDEKPYWNGTNAYNVLKNALGQYDNNKALLDYIVKCRKAIKK